MHFDLFCSVVDNYGDIGVCWRLARQLEGEQGARVRLWVDDLAVFRRLAPGIDPGLQTQFLGAIEVRRWTQPFADVEPADVAIETFGCDLPTSYVQAMAARPRPPLWINLEYLSAETWVEGCHGLPSPHPRLPLTRYFFFPGFSAATGGVLIEQGLLDRCEAFQGNPAASVALLDRLGVAARGDGEMLVSLFCYDQAPLGALFDAWASGGQRVRAIGFEGTASANALEQHGLSGGRVRGGLSGAIVPFLSQDDYDRVLWACDWNFVRGEDSFVRAQLAGRPFAWQAYPQAGEAHRVKVQAFLDCYVATGPERAAVEALWTAWNGFVPAGEVAAAWAACNTRQAEIARAAAPWPRRLEALGGLAGNLARFCSERV